MAIFQVVIAISLLFVCASPLASAEKSEASRPVAEILGKPVTLQDLDAGAGSSGEKSSAARDTDALKHQRQEQFRALVWRAVFDDYTRQRRIEPAPAEIESQIVYGRKFEREDRIRSEKRRRELIAELKAPGLSEERRKQAQSSLDTLDRLKELDARREQENRDPERKRTRDAAEWAVTTQWVRTWKMNQALYREFGGRVIFQQTGWEPIDAYRKVIESYEAKRALVVHDPTLREAVYSYFGKSHSYADEAKAKLYFEKPYWERTEAELKAAGF